MLLAADLRLALDASVIGSRCDLVLDGWQAELLRARPKRALLLCSRQSGKSTVTALLALHTAMFEVGSLSIIVSPSQRQSGELFRTVMQYRAKLDAPLTAESALRAEFANTSRIIALPGSEKTVRGYAAASLVIIDEAARVEDTLLASVRPMLAVRDGSLICLSTPAGKRGWFYEAWTGGDESWHRTLVPASQCPRLSAAFLADELRVLGPQAYRQEYDPLDFVDDCEAVFSSDLIARAFSSEVRPLWQ